MILVTLQAPPLFFPQSSSTRKVEVAPCFCAVCAPVCLCSCMFESLSASAGKASGKAGDMWAVGVVFYCMAVGELPFFGANYRLSCSPCWQGVFMYWPLLSQPFDHDWQSELLLAILRRLLVPSCWLIVFGIPSSLLVALSELAAEVSKADPFYPEDVHPQLVDLIKGLLTKCDTPKHLAASSERSSLPLSVCFWLFWAVTAPI